MRSTKLIVMAIPMLASAAAFGQISFNSINPSSDGTESISSTGLFGYPGPLGASFSVGPIATSLDQVILSLENPNSTTSSFTVSLETDASIAPSGTVLESKVISDSMVAPVSTLLSVDLPSMILSANTRYWVVLSGDTSGVTWDYSSDGSGPGVNTEFYANSTGVFANGSYPFMMQVTPEPSSFAYLGLGLLPFVLRRRKRA